MADARSNGAGHVAMVLPGGGARGAYEAGALSALLPALAERGQRVSVWCGTSAGAINAALFASLAHLPVERQVAAAVDRWRSIRRQDVMAPLLGPYLPETVLRLAGEMLGVPGVRFRSILDGRPLARNLGSWIDFDRLNANVKSGAVGSVCVVATAAVDGRPVAFVQGAASDNLARASEDIRYVRARITAEHVRASAAIPIVFPAVEVRSPQRARGYYLDGGTRLNSPLKPALDLGAQYLAVVGFEPLRTGAFPAASERAPHLGEIAANALDGLLLDQVNADLRRLAAINAFFTAGISDSLGPGSVRAAQLYREARGRHPYRRVPYAIVTPERRRELGEIAERVFHERYGGLRALRHPDYLVLGRLLGAGASRGELLSFLLFDERYMEALIDAGRSDAERWLSQHPRLWCSDPAHDFDFDSTNAQAQSEAASLEEWRDLQQRR